MATAELPSSGTNYTISTNDFLVKLRRDSSGVALAHDDVDNNFETLRRTLNDLIEDVDAVTAGTLEDVSTSNLKVDNISADAVGTAQIAVDGVTGDKRANNSVGAAQIIDGSLTEDDLNISAATTSDPGFMSSADKTKLDGVATGANLYTHPPHPGDDFSADTGALTGAAVVSDIDINVTTDTAGHVTDANCVISTRNLVFTGDVTIASNGATTLVDNVVTSAHLSDTDGLLLVNDTSSPKKVVVNESGADVDFRVEGSNNAHLLFTDAGRNTVMIGASVTNYESLVSSFNIQPVLGVSTDGSPASSGAEPVLLVENTNASSGEIASATVVICGNGTPTLQLYDTSTSGTDDAIYNLSSGNGHFKIVRISDDHLTAIEVFRIDPDGNIHMRAGKSISYDLG